MKVCSVIDTLHYGGAETLLLEITRRASFEHVVCYRRGQGERMDEFDHAGADVRSLKFSWQYDVFGFERLANVAKDADIIHSHLPASVIAGRIAGLRAGVPVVSTHHNMPSTYGMVSKTLERATRDIEDLTIAVSNGVMEAHGGEDWEVIYNGIDVKEFSRRVSDSEWEVLREELSLDSSVTLLSIGRYTKQKSQRDLIEMMNRLSERGHDCHLLLVGSGPLEDELRRYASERGIEARVTITGRVPDVAPYYGVADIFVSASAQEGLPITFLEAMAAKLPIIATDIPGVREIVLEGRTGLFISHRDPEGLADAVVGILGDVDAYGEAAYDRVEENFHINQTINEYEEVYRKLLQ